MGGLSIVTCELSTNAGDFAHVRMVHFRRNEPFCDLETSLLSPLKSVLLKVSHFCKVNHSSLDRSVQAILTASNQLIIEVVA